MYKKANLRQQVNKYMNYAKCVRSSSMYCRIVMEARSSYLHIWEVVIDEVFMLGLHPHLYSPFIIVHLYMVSTPGEAVRLGTGDVA